MEAGRGELPGTRTCTPTRSRPPPSLRRTRPSTPPCACAASQRSPRAPFLLSRDSVRKRVPGCASQPLGTQTSGSASLLPRGLEQLMPSLAWEEPATCSPPQLAPHSPRWAGRSCGFRPHMLRRCRPGLWLKLPPQDEPNGYQRPFPRLHALGPGCCWQQGRALRGSPGRPR